MLGEGLPTILAKLVKKTLKGEYVDMAVLLQDREEAVRCQGDQPASSAGGARWPLREVPDVLSWLQCFGACASIVTHKQPSRARELWAHQPTTVREARRSPPSTQ